MKIGEKIKNLRLAQELTQEELANRADLTKGFISLLERDLQSPSLDTLELILNALDTNPKEFFSDEGEEVVVFHRSQRVSITDGDEPGVKREVLIAGAQDREMDLLLVTLKPGASTYQERAHYGDECGYVLTGKIVINIGKETYKASAGDTFYYTANRKHWIENKSDKPAKILWISAPPSF
ncbi:MAG TPA: XRE family transcriptional regulator [Deltaproteobacteria bacterium]|nr:XRE family transcriptional regulator [Deltaproteobacteria bacterium]HOM30247.1 XRE family transcriptional regulator [Deltaproteobacteria bacterium]